MKLALVLLMLAVGAMADDVAPDEKLVPDHKPEEVPQVVAPSLPYSYAYPYTGYPYLPYQYYPPSWYVYPYAAAPAPAPAAVPVAPSPVAHAAKLLYTPYRVDAPVGASTYYGLWQ